MACVPGLLGAHISFLGIRQPRIDFNVQCLE